MSEEGRRLSDDVTVVMGADAAGPGCGNGRAIAVLLAWHRFPLVTPYFPLALD